MIPQGVRLHMVQIHRMTISCQKAIDHACGVDLVLDFETDLQVHLIGQLRMNQLPSGKLT